MQNTPMKDMTITEIAKELRKRLIHDIDNENKRWYITVMDTGMDVHQIILNADKEFPITFRMQTCCVSFDRTTAEEVLMHMRMEHFGEE